MEHCRGIVAHGNHLRCKGHLYAVRQRIDALFLQALQNFFTLAHQNDLHSIVLCSCNSAHDRSLRGVVTTHCVYDNLHRMLLSTGFTAGF